MLEQHVLGLSVRTTTNEYLYDDSCELPWRRKKRQAVVPASLI